MNKFNINSNLLTKIDTGAEYLSVFCFDGLSINEAFLVLINEVFKEETINTLREYGEVLEGIHNRLISEGYIFIDGKFYKEEYNTK